MNITYSVKLEEVPGEVNRILEECEQVFRSCHGTLDQTMGRDPLTIIDELDKVRKNLASLDLKLDDAMSILSGYIQAVASKPEMEQRAMQAPTERSESDDEEL
ncbi:MAG: hypothetical protein H8E74_00680 [Gammaproteobacteria bacterium]|nr:hypothetical protein [Gammaproteobacteria bacterium]